MVNGVMVERGVDRLVVGLDVPTADEAIALAEGLQGHVGVFKVGLELFSAHGPDVVRRIAEYGPVFLDLKLHDIPNTVERAAARVADLGVTYLTTHASGGPSMVEAAVRGLGEAGSVLAVTVLTSMSAEDCDAVGWGTDPSAQVARLARMAVDAGAPGLVCAAPDAPGVRADLGPDALLVTPGIRPTGSDVGDQSRVSTPAGAIRDGATMIVVGRPITRAEDPAAAADAIVAELDAALA